MTTPRRDHQDAAEARATAAKTLTDREQGYLAALADERAGYVTRGLTSRVAEVDAEVKRVRGA